MHHGLYQNETTEYCHWHVNEAHYLEPWGDARAYDGTVSIVQPLIAPLYDGKSEHELVSALSGVSDATGYDMVRAYWQKQHAARTSRLLAQVAARWLDRRYDLLGEIGFREGGAFARIAVGRCRPKFSRGHLPPRSLDLRRQFANNGWLQELPKPMTKLTWDNAVLISPKMATREGLKTEDMVEIELNGRKVNCRSGSRRDIPTTPSRCFWDTGASARESRERALASMSIRCAPARLRGSRRRQAHQDRGQLRACLHAGLPDNGNAQRRDPSARARSDPRGISQGSELRAGRASCRENSRCIPTSTTPSRTTPGAWRST